MTAANYTECLRRLLIHEGGYCNDPGDPGGPTKYGITIYDYRLYIDRNGTASDVKNMTVEQAEKIYRKRYWDALRCDELPSGVDYSVFDYGVNSGIGRSAKVLRRICGLPAGTTITPDVVAAVNARDSVGVINALNDERLRFLQGLSTWSIFGRGWGRRVSEVRAFSLKLASQMGIVLDPSSMVKEKAPDQLSQAEKKTLQSTTGATMGLGLLFWDFIKDHPVQFALGAVVVVGLVLYIFRHYKAEETPVLPVHRD
jgi:lysozyme family protein